MPPDGKHTPPTPPAPPVRSLLLGFRLALEGASLLRRERALWAPAVVPVLLSLAAFATAIGVIVAGSGSLWDLATSWGASPVADRWFEWLWVGPLVLLVGAFQALVFLALCAAALVAAYLVASLLASPFHDALSRRVEKLVTGRVVDESAPGLAGAVVEGLRAAREELRRLLSFVALVGPLALVGLLVPPLQVLTGPAVAAITILFLPLDYASYTLDRRRLSFRQKRRWLLARTPQMAGFGAAAFLLLLVPVANFVATPVLVVAGTLLALRAQEPARSR